MEMELKQGAVAAKARAEKMAYIDALTTAFPVARGATVACEYLEAQVVS